MKTIRRFGLLALATTVFAGCMSLPSVGPDYEEREYEVPEYALPDAGAPTTNLTATCEYASAATNEDNRVVISSEATARWWERFNDPILVELMTSAVSNNVGYLMAQSRLEQANWNLLGSYAAFLPKVGAEGAWTRNFYRKNTSQGARVNANALHLGLDAAWEIDIFGGSRRQTEVALAMAEAAGWTVADAWVSLTTQLGEKYINLRTTQERLEVARTNLVLQSETYEIVKSRLDSGIGDELAVQQCLYIVEQTRARIPQLITQEEQIKNEISILAGVMPGSISEKLAPLKNRRDWLLAPQKVEGLPLNMMRSRPDVKIAERQLAAKTAAIGVAKAQWFPKLALTGSVGLESTPDESKIFSRDSFFGSLGPVVSWPIFQGGAIYASVKAAEAALEEATLGYELAVENAYGEVRNSYSAYTQEYHRYQALAGAVKAATDAVVISQDLYKNGLKDFNNVLDAQRSRLQLEEEFVLSRGQITLNLIELYKALGGGLAVSE